MELKINLMELTIDQIVRKIKSFKFDPNLISLTLNVKRKNMKVGRNHPTIQNIQGIEESYLVKSRDKENANSSSNRNRNGKQKYEDKQSNQNQTKYKQQNKDKIKQTDSDKIKVGFDHILRRDSHIITDHYQYTTNSNNINMTMNINDKKLIKAKNHYVQGNYENAITILTQLLEQSQLQNKQNKNNNQNRNTNQTNPSSKSAEIQGDKQRKLATITFTLANSYYRLKNYEKAIQFYSYEIPQQNYKHKAMRKSNLGAIYLHLNKNQQSLKNYNNALKIYGQCGCEQVDLSNIYHNVGNIYQREKMYQVAEKYYNMAIQERKNKSVDSELSLFYSVFKLGVAQKCQEKYQESIKTLFYALSFVERGVGDCIEIYKQIAIIYQHLQKLNDALNFYEKICDNTKATQEIKGYAYQRAASIYLRIQKQNEGKRILKIAQQFYQRSGNQRKLSQVRKQIKIIHVTNQS